MHQVLFIDGHDEQSAAVIRTMGIDQHIHFPDLLQPLVDGFRIVNLPALRPRLLRS